MKSTKTLILVLAVALFALCSCAAKSSTAGADPLSGRWKGEWGPTPERQTNVVVDFKWDGKELHGSVDPDGNTFPFTKASFDPQTSAVKMELDGPNSRREKVHYVIEGKISGEVMSGTFDRAGEKGTFKIEKR